MVRRKPLVCAGMMLMGLVDGISNTARAQDAVTRIIEQRTRDELQFAQPDYLLVRPGHVDLSMTANVSPNMSTNAFLDDASKASDIAIVSTASAQLTYRWSRKVAIVVAVVPVWSRNMRFSELDYDATTTAVTAHFNHDGWLAAVNWRFIDAHKPLYSDHIVTQNGFAASLSRLTRVGASLALVTNLTADRIEATPDIFSNTGLRFGVGAVWSVRPSVLLRASASGHARWYDHDFDRSGRRPRRDLGLSIDAEIIWQASRILALSARAAFGYQHSTSPTSRYTEFSVTPTISAQVRW